MVINSLSESLHEKILSGFSGNVFVDESIEFDDISFIIWDQLFEDYGLDRFIHLMD